MSEEIKKADSVEQSKPELGEQDLDQIAGGGFNYQKLPSDKVEFKKMPEEDPPLAPLRGI